jgi:serine/threonine-protein kinase RsbW
MNDPEAPLFVLTVRSELRLLSLVRKALAEACRLAGLDAHGCYETTLAVNEACANIILHGHGPRPELTFSVSVYLAPGCLQVALRDQGERFDLHAQAEPDPTELRRGGRGLLLIRRLVDRVEVEHPPGGGNILRLFKQIPGA